MSNTIQAKQNPSADNVRPIDSVLGPWIVQLSVYADVLLRDWQIRPLDVQYSQIDRCWEFTGTGYNSIEDRAEHPLAHGDGSQTNPLSSSFPIRSTSGDLFNFVCTR